MSEAIKIIHLAPAAFDYFNDIKARVFALAEALSSAGLPTEVLTLQYGATTRGEKTATKAAAPGLEYIGAVGLAEVLETLPEYHIVHLHCPFLGAARAIMAVRQKHPSRPFVITWHRPVFYKDIFSLFVRAYNAYWLPHLFNAADAVTCFSASEFERAWGQKTRYADKLTEIEDLTNADSVIKLMGLYKQLLIK